MSSDADKVWRLAEAVVAGEISLGDAVLALPPSDTDKYTYVSVEDATRDPAGSAHWDLYEDRWWVVHPEKGLAFWGRYMTAQCNAHKSIADRLVPEGHEVRFFPRVWMRHNCYDYL